MGKITKKQNIKIFLKRISNKLTSGITLVELLVYMSIFSFIFMLTMSSSFYLQKIIENNNKNYYVKNQIYQNLNILQEYLYKTHVEIDVQNINFINKSNKLVLTQTFENGHIKNIYENKSFLVNEYVHLEKYEAKLEDDNHILKIQISWLDNRKKMKNITEYLIVINTNL
jgi:hypothetical protein